MQEPARRFAHCQLRSWVCVVAFFSYCDGHLEAQGFPGYEQRTTSWKTEFESGRYKIHCDFALASPQSIVAEFRSLEVDMEALLGFQPQKNAVIHLVLFRTAPEYQRYMERHFPGLPKRRAIFIQYRGPGMLFAHWHTEVIHDLRHEVTHALLNDGKHPLPLWLDEGLAEYFEPKREARSNANPYLADIVGLAKEGGIRSLRELESISDVRSFTEDNYRDSWAWVHYLIHRQPATRELLARYLQEHFSEDQGFDLVETLARMFPDLGEDMQQHFLAIRPQEGSAESKLP